MSEKTVEELVEEAKKPGVFNILSVLKERAYPHDEVNIYLDEQAAYDASALKEKLESADVDEMDAIEAKLNEAVARLEASKYVFTINGISEGLREDILAQAAEQYPIEFEEDKNPFTGEIAKREVENKQRDRLFTNLLWHESIIKIVNPDGDVQESVSMKDIESLRKLLPIAGIGAINNAVEKLRISTATFMLSVDEDFLAKS